MVEKHILPSGLRVVLAPRVGALATNVMVLVEAGSKYETKEISGLSHFLEHLCFKGTKKRPKPMDVSSALDALGASYNAFTSQEFTGYYATVAPNQAERALELVADLYLHPTIPKDEIEKEKGVIVEEINMYEDMPQRDVQDLLWRVMYGDQPAGWGVIGTKASVRAMTREQIVKYRSEHYVAQATTVVVAGDFEPKKMLRAVSQEFKNLKKGRKGKKLPVRERQTEPQVLLKEKASDQTHFVLGWRGRPLGHRDESGLAVLAAVLGGGMSSRLWRRVREELGAAYYVGAAHEALTDHGLFQIFVGADTTRVEQIIEVALDECSKLIKQTVPNAELKRARDAMIGRFYLGLEKTSDLGQFYGFQELLEYRLREPETVVKKIEAVSAADLQRLAARIFQPRQLNLALIGPFRNPAVFLDIVRR